MGIAGGSAPSLKHQNLMFFKWISLVVFTRWCPVFACHQRTLGSHELTYLGDPISVTFVTNGHQSCPNLKISLFSTLTVLCSHLVASKGIIGWSLRGLKTDLQRCEKILLLFFPYAPSVSKGLN